MATQPTDSVLVNQKSLLELAAMLVRDANIHEGLFDISIELQLSIGTFGNPAGEVLPGAIVGVRSVGLLPTVTANPTTVDAGKVNPRPAVAKKIAARRKP